MAYNIAYQATNNILEKTLASPFLIVLPIYLEAIPKVCSGSKSLLKKRDKYF